MFASLIKTEDYCLGYCDLQQEEGDTTGGQIK